MHATSPPLLCPPPASTLELWLKGLGHHDKERQRDKWDGAGIDDLKWCFFSWTWMCCGGGTQRGEELLNIMYVIWKCVQNLISFFFRSIGLQLWGFILHRKCFTGVGVFASKCLSLCSIQNGFKLICLQSLYPLTLFSPPPPLLKQYNPPHPWI